MNPVLIEVTRGGLIESRHRGALAVADHAGRTLLTIGDVDTPVFPRSAIKALQAVPLIESGASDRFGFDDAAIALAAASHAGTKRHVDVAQAMLDRIGLSARHLACGAHRPLSAAAARDLDRRDQEPTPLHNNCSGKHAGMLATAVHANEPLTDYWHPQHPVQVRVRDVLERLSGISLSGVACGIDGCSIPNWPMPIACLARAFAAFVAPGDAAPCRAAAERIMRACWSQPELVAGEGRLDTTVMRCLPGDVFLKGGAEGVYCAGLPQRGLGIALKIDDGAKRAVEPMVMQVLARLEPAAADLIPNTEQRNWNGLVTGQIALAPEIAATLDQLKA